MKHILRIISTITLISSLSIQSAANDQPLVLADNTSSPTTFDTIIGAQCSPRGKFAVSQYGPIDSKQVAFALAYSEHPKFTDEILSSLVHDMFSLSLTGKLTADLFRQLCENELSKHVPMALKRHTERKLETIPSSNRTFFLLAHFLILDTRKFTCVSYNEDDLITSGSCKLNNELPSGNILAHSILSEGFIRHSSEEIESAQDEAIRLQQHNSNKALHIVANVAKWRTMLGNSYPDEPEIDQDVPTSRSPKQKKKDGCTVV